jgi:uncharacterized membrane protein YfcA
MPDLSTLALLGATTFLAGFVDSIAGGGGLLTVPALLLAGFDPVTAIATNKVQGTLAIVSALFTYARKGLVEWRAGMPMFVMALIFGATGAASVHLMSKTFLNAIVPIALILVALYFGFARGLSDKDRKAQLTRLAFIGAVVPPIAFYDGFFGPGGGSFYAMALVSLLGLGLTRTTAMAKVLNGGSNAGSLLIFSLAGSVLWLVGIGMALCSMAGAQLGSRLAVGYGAKLIRPLIVMVCVALVIRLLADPANPMHIFLAQMLNLA